MKNVILAAVRCSLMFTAVAALSIASPAKANLITNGGFETGDFTGWTTGVDGTTAAVTGTFNSVSPHSGNFQAVFNGVAFLTGTAFAQQTLTTTPGTNYTLEFFLAVGGVAHNPPGFFVQFGDSTVFSHSFFVGSRYAEYTFDVTSSTASTLLKFGFFVNSATLYLDDVSVTRPGAVPDCGSTVSLLGFGLLGLAALRCELVC
jgi:hypothetical protein